MKNGDIVTIDDRKWSIQNVVKTEDTFPGPIYNVDLVPIFHLSDSCSGLQSPNYSPLDFLKL